ncbi:MAG: amidase family protein, partial [Stellaceae bacterium]
ATPLSTTLDSIGPLANSVACCARTDAVMAGEPAAVPPAMPVSLLRLGVPQTIMLDDLDPEVAAAFERACKALSRQGARIVDLPLAELGEYAAINANGGFSPPEAYTWHADLIARRGADYDPRVRLRIERGGATSATDYVRLCWQRADFIDRIAARTAEFDALIMPTVPLVAPPIAAFASDEEYWRLNGRILRNTSIVNFLDGCAVTLPIQAPGRAPVGLMAAGPRGADRQILSAALGIEAALERERNR